MDTAMVDKSDDTKRLGSAKKRVLVTPNDNIEQFLAMHIGLKNLSCMTDITRKSSKAGKVMMSPSAEAFIMESMYFFRLMEFH